MRGIKSITDYLTGRAEVDADVIRRLSALLDETGLNEIEIEQNGARIRVARRANGSAAAESETAAHAQSPTVAAVETKAAVKGPVPGAVTSPLVGTAYLGPEPGATPFVSVGQHVKEGDTLLIIEAMKTMNPITAPRAGTVTEIGVKDAEPVEFGQMLVIIT
jgi:acetyl-CoA carboxylase biotin carboxyl carrier protein